MDSRHKGFVLVNSSPGVYVVHDDHKSEFDRLRSEGWRIARIRPICTSLRLKLKHMPDDVRRSHAFSYSFCVLEKGDPRNRRS